MLTFTNTQVTHEQFVKAISRHIEMDALVQDVNRKENDGFKGGHVGCTLHDFGVSKVNHAAYAAYERLFGIPRIIARLCDTIHYRLREDETVNFFEAFWDAVKPGQDLSMVWVKFSLWLLIDGSNPDRLNQHETVRQEIEQVADVYKNWLSTGSVDSTAEAAARAADVAAHTADEVAAYAAYAAARAADVASRHATDVNPRYVADSAEAATRYTANTAEYAAARAAPDATEYAAANAFWQLASKKLIQLIQDSPVIETA